MSKTHQPHPRQRFKLGGVALAISLLQAPAWAVDYQWLGGGGAWEDASRWSLLGVPGSGDTALIANTGTGSVVLNGTRGLDALTMNGGKLGGAGTLNTVQLTFNGGTLGATAFGSGGTVNVSGSSVLNGAANLGIQWSQVLNLNGNATWTVGNGRIGIDTAYSSGNASYATSAMNIAAGTTFTDQGATNAASYKQLGSGLTQNAGTYERNGLGTTWATGVVNTGVVNVNSGSFGFDSGNTLSQSSGTINIAAGTTLQVANLNVTAGSINNSGLVRVFAGSSSIAAGAGINGNWVIDAGTLTLSGSHAIGNLTMNGGKTAGAGTLDVDSLTFNGGTLGATAFGSGGTMNVAGNAVLNGTANLGLMWSQMLNLNGNATWTAGNGRISVDPAYSSGNASYATSAMNIAAGTTFTDQGATNAASYKQLGSGLTQNAGTYERNGLGTTWVTGLVNTGVVNVNSGSFGFDSGNTLSQSSGTINIAAGTTLQVANLNVTAGSINNSGLVRVFAGSSSIAAGAGINGNWVIDAGTLTLSGSHAIGNLTMNGGKTAGAGTLDVDSLTFNGGTLGATAFGTGGTVNVAGNAVLNGTANQGLMWSQTLNLNGNTTWTAGNGRISIDRAYSSGSASYATSAMNIAAGTTFTDQGAASTSGYKLIAGGPVLNAGAFVRQGLGATEIDRLNNTGRVQIAEGSLGVRDTFVNTGTVQIDAGATLYGIDRALNNDGLLTGNGVLRTYSADYALNNRGTIDPGTGATIGTLTIQGGLAMSDSATLHIDLGAAGLSDQLTVSQSALWNGTLAVWAPQGLALHQGDSFVIATFGQRAAGSVFDNLVWLGAGSNPFTVEYGANDITLRVTAVPEPGTWALALAGGAFLLSRSRRRPR